MRGWTRALLGGLLLCAVAAAGIGLNFTLLRLTGDAHDPVGRLSPRAVFSGEAEAPRTTTTQPATQTTPTQTTPTTTETVPGSDDGSGKSDGSGKDDSDADDD